MPATAVSKPGLPHELVDPRMSSDLRVKACLPYLPLIRNTASMRFLRWLASFLPCAECFGTGHASCPRCRR